MKADIRVLDAPEEFALIRREWNALVQDDPVALRGLDLTCTYEWFDAIRNSFPQASQPRIVTVRDGAALVGILPIAIAGRSLAGSELIVPSELHGGRNGFLLARPEPELLRRLLEHLHDAVPHWLSFRLTLPLGSPSESLLRQVCSTTGFGLIQDAPVRSVYIPLESTTEAFQKKMTKDLRYRIRTGPRKLAELGKVEYWELTSEDQSGELLDSVLDVERQSWKHAAGTAITSLPQQEAFYKAMFPRMMRRRMLYGLVMSLEKRPAAYIFGLLSDHVFSSLKISQIESLSKLSLSHLVRYQCIERLRGRGVRVLESTGFDDPHKMRWSSDHGFVSCSRFTVFNQNIAGQVAYRVRSAKNFIKRRARSDPRSEGGNFDSESARAVSTDEDGSHKARP